MNWSRPGAVALPFVLYVFIALFALDSFGFEKLLNPLYTATASSVLQFQSVVSTETMLALQNAVRFLVFSFGFALLYSPALLFSRHASFVAALIAPAAVLAFALMAIQPHMLPFVAGNDFSHATGVILAIFAPSLLLGFFARVRRLAANNSSKPTPLRGAA